MTFGQMLKTSPQNRPKNVMYYGVVSLDESMADNDIIRKIVRDEYGVLIDAEICKEKPSMLPMEHMVNIDFDRKITEDISNILLTRDISKYLLNLTIILNVEPKSSCSKYFISPSVHFDKNFLCISKDILEKILMQIENFPLSRIRLIADSIHLNCDIKLHEIIDKILGINKSILITSNLSNIRNDKRIEHLDYEYLIDTYSNLNELKHLIHDSLQRKSSYRFIIRNVTEYETAIKMASDFELENYSILPFYNGANDEFISDILSQDVSDIFVRPIKIKEIYRNSKLNSNLFGKLLITPDGAIYSDDFSSNIGKVCTHNILDCILFELTSNKGWRHIRDFEKCRKCLFQYICPPPSKLENILNITDKCNAFTP